MKKAVFTGTEFEYSSPDVLNSMVYYHSHTPCLNPSDAILMKKYFAMSI